MSGGGVFLCRNCVYDEDGPHIVGSIAMDGICVRCSGLAMEVFMGECQEPRKAYAQDRRAYQRYDFTTVNTIVLYTVIVWDVNNYYRDLGVSPKATKREIREAYQRAEGWTSYRLTYIVKQLLNDEVRSLYDQTPPGSLFIDHFLMRAIERRIEDDLMRHFAEGGSTEMTERIDLSHLLNKPLQVVDKDHGGGHYEPPLWSWGFYLWQSGCRDNGKLRRWQEHLIRAFQDRKEVRRIAIGFCGSHIAGPVHVVQDDYLTIVLLNESEQPTAALASQAADRVNHIHDDQRSFVTAP